MAGSIGEHLAGEQILVTGSTGFLAKALVEKLLRSVSSIGGLYLLVRPRAEGVAPRERVRGELFHSRGFDRFRAVWGDRAEEFFDEKVHVVGGDLTQGRLGLSHDEYQALARRITLVVNSAATVTFDERIDHAVELNARGPSRLLQLAKDCGNVPLLHVSTCYVCGVRRGVVVEDFSAPEPARESLPRDPKTLGFDLDQIVESLLATATQVRLRLGADTEACRRELIDEGMRIARSYGWNDTYTFTKWIGEQLLRRDHGEVPLWVFRPAIIEGSYEEPMPGWIDGLRMADPIIVAYGKGKLDDFPGRADTTIDFVPVDFVVNGMIAVLAEAAALRKAGGGEGTSHDNGHNGKGSIQWNRGAVCKVVQCASSDRNPLQIGRLAEYLEEAFRTAPMRGDDGKPVSVRPLRFVSQAEFLRNWTAKEASLLRMKRLLERMRLARNRVRKLGATLRQIEQVVYFAKIYSPYTGLDCRFADDHLRLLAERMSADDRATFPFDPTGIDWRDYIVHRHVPGLRKFVLPGSAEPIGRIVGLPRVKAGAEEPEPGNLYEAFLRSVHRHPHKTALRIRRGGKWLSYTYQEAADAAGGIMRRMRERGIRPGDRVAICGENSPEWGLTYLALMRMGATAVPIDPQLLPSDVFNCAAFARARLVCAGRTTFEHLAQAFEGSNVPVVQMSEPLVPAPGAARDDLPPAEPVSPDAIASILFTSGTTLTPKAVPLAHGNFLANAGALCAIFPLDARDEFLSVLPMYHAFEFTGGFLVPLMLGATVTYVEQLKGAEITSAMQATGTTILLVVPRLLWLFHDSIQSAVAGGGVIRRGMFGLMNLASRVTRGRYARRIFAPIHRNFGGQLRFFVSGGAALDEKLFYFFHRLGLPVYEGYGLTETSPVLTLSPFDAPRPKSVGLPLPNIELEIRNQNLDGVGEVWVRGPSVMLGYLDDEQATAEVMKDGWFRTGDLGRRDADGYLYLTGRSKDLIVTAAGKNVYPDEVEARYRDLPHVKELCVFGLPTSQGCGDVVHAVVVVNEEDAVGLDRSSIEREIRTAAEAIAANVPPHQRIAVFHFWDHELPKTTTLKAKRGLIRDMVRNGSTSTQTARAPVTLRRPGQQRPSVVRNQAAFDALRQIIAQHHPGAAHDLDPSAHLLLDLGIDSIGKIDLIGAVESTFNLRVSDAEATKIARLADLLNLIGDRQPVQASRASNIFHRLVGASSIGQNNGHLRLRVLPARWIARGAVGVMMHTYVRVKTKGRQHLPASGPFLLAPNHASHLDAPAVLTAIGGRRRVFVAGAQDYFFNTPARQFIFGQLFDTVPFDRHSDGLDGLRRCGEILSRGDGVLIFPEGTRSLTGRLQPFRIGVAVLAVEYKAPVIPVHIAHSFELMPKGSRFVRPGVIRVTFGAPIVPPAEGEVPDPYTTFQLVTRRIEKSVVALSKERAG